MVLFHTMRILAHHPHMPPVWLFTGVSGGDSRCQAHHIFWFVGCLELVCASVSIWIFAWLTCGISGNRSIGVFSMLSRFQLACQTVAHAVSSCVYVCVPCS